MWDCTLIQRALSEDLGMKFEIRRCEEKDFNGVFHLAPLARRG